MISSQNDDDKRVTHKIIKNKKKKLKIRVIY